MALASYQLAYLLRDGPSWTQCAQTGVDGGTQLPKCFHTAKLPGRPVMKSAEQTPIMVNIEAHRVE